MQTYIRTRSRARLKGERPHPIIAPVHFARPHHGIMSSESRDSGRAALRLVDLEKEAGRINARPDVHRFPPTVQVLNMTTPHIQERMQDIAMIGFRRGLKSDAICVELHTYARTFDYEATIAVQEVKTREMPSFPGSTVVSAIMLVDLRPARRELRLCKRSFAADG